MKISRQKLITLIDKEITRLQQIVTDNHNQKVRDATRQATEYTERTSAAWELFAQRIGVALVSGNPVTSDLVPPELRDRYDKSHVRVFETRVISQAAQHPRVVELNTLKNVLEASTDEEISTYALEKQGFPLGRVLKGQ